MTVQTKYCLLMLLAFKWLNYAFKCVGGRATTDGSWPAPSCCRWVDAHGLNAHYASISTDHQYTPPPHKLSVTHCVDLHLFNLHSTRARVDIKPLQPNKCHLRIPTWTGWWSAAVTMYFAPFIHWSVCLSSFWFNYSCSHHHSAYRHQPPPPLASLLSSLPIDLAKRLTPLDTQHC